jgi:hypothetical protein
VVTGQGQYVSHNILLRIRKIESSNLGPDTGYAEVFDAYS